MKKVRVVFVFLCVMVMMLSAVTMATADSRSVLHLNAASKAFGYDNEFYLLKNGKTVSFYVCSDYVSSLFPVSAADDNGNYGYRDILFDCDGRVTAKTSASWVTINNNAGGFNVYYSSNETLKNRTAVITVTGKNYSAKIKLTQYGKNVFTKAERKGKLVKMYFNLAKAATGGEIDINCYTTVAGEEIYKTKTIKVKKGQTYASFTAESGYDYSIFLSGIYKYGKKRTLSNSTDYLFFETNSGNIDGDEQIR